MLSKGNPLSRFLLQYRETDWEFLKRLAGIEGGVLVPIPASSKGSFWYGLPGGNREPIEDEDGVKRTVIQYGKYCDRNAIDFENTFLPDFYRFTVQSRKNYRPGYKATLNYVQ